ncbi:uncharacterized protein LOC124443166 [Xenia sp. Carnegie-2017]|uniref:uncharacterized protein LOC124443166 n=1 Tax=Xenia sp. Carnegie-2017 TaxID=2897299 RepID=UPI001F0407C3|nr:uncharacterized protein LOC124443166 [Xenia sp. Carnegie-2017]
MTVAILRLAFLLLFIQLIKSHENDLSGRREEKFSIAVDIIEEEDDKGLSVRKSSVKVNLNISIEEDAVKVNGKSTELDVRIVYELKAEIEYPDRNEKHFAPIVVHVMVSREKFGKGHRYLIEEKVTKIDGKKVEQLELKVLKVHMDVNGKEYERTVETVAFKESRLARTRITRYCGHGDEKPRRWLGPELPDEHFYGHKHKHQSLCSRFHKLPLGARIAIFVAFIVAILIFVVSFTKFCCRKKSTTCDVGKDDFKPDLNAEDEALPEKLSFDDKEILIA